MRSKAAAANVVPGFVARLFAHAAPEDLVGYSPDELAALAEQAWQFLQSRKPGTPKIRFADPETPPGGARLKGISVIEIVNDDMPFLVDSVMSALTEHESVDPACRASDPDRDARRIRRAHGACMTSTRATIRRCAKASSTSMSSASTTTSAAPRSIQDLEQSLSDVRLAVDGLAADARPRRRSDRGAEEQSAAAAGGRDRGSDPVPGMADREQFHVPRRARSCLLRRYRDAGREVRNRPRHPAQSDRAAPAAPADDAGNARRVRRAAGAVHQQDRCRARACIAACSWIMSA